MNSLRRFVFAALLGAGLFALPGLARTHRVIVPAAEADRAAQVVEFKLPDDAKGLTVVADAKGGLQSLQVDADGTARFVIPWQKAGETLTFTLSEAKLKRGPGVEVKQNPGNLAVTVEGAPLFGYQMDKDALPRPDIDPKYKRAGYLHPVFTPSGKIVSDDYPKQHIHHHGIWAPWTKASFQGRTPDFWNMGAKTGLVEFVALDRTWGGPVHGGFVARHRFIDLSAPGGALPVLNETWEVTAYDVPAANGAVLRVFDLTITQACATDDPLILPEYHYGGLGFRGRGEWLGEANAKFLTANGETDRVKAHASKANWINMHGAVEGGAIAGMTVFSHPGNFRAPQPLRVHPKEPFICYAPSQGGDWKIGPGKPYVARYRFLASDGAPDRAQLEAVWAGYASVAVAKVESAP